MGVCFAFFLYCLSFIDKVLFDLIHLENLHLNKYK